MGGSRKRRSLQKRKQMAQNEPSDTATASCGGGDENVSVRERASSVDAGDRYETAAASSSHDSCEVQTEAVREESIAQGRSELADDAQAAAAESPSHGHDALTWEKLKESYPLVFRDLGHIVELGKVIGEDRNVHIYEASINGRGKLMALVSDKEDFSVADIDRQFPLAPIFSEPRHKWDGFVLGNFDFRHIVRFSGRIDFGTFLKDGRFAFVMPRCQKELEREWEDALRRHKRSMESPHSIGFLGHRFWDLQSLTELIKRFWEIPTLYAIQPEVYTAYIVVLIPNSKVEVPYCACNDQNKIIV